MLTFNALEKLEKKHSVRWVDPKNRKDGSLDGSLVCNFSYSFDLFVYLMVPTLVKDISHILYILSEKELTEAFGPRSDISLSKCIVLGFFPT